MTVLSLTWESHTWKDGLYIETGLGSSGYEADERWEISGHVGLVASASMSTRIGPFAKLSQPQLLYIGISTPPPSNHPCWAW